MAHTIRTNPDHSQFQIALDSNTLSEVCDAREDMTFIQDENGDIYLASFGPRQDDDLLEPETLYLLKPVSALVEEVDEFETDDDEEDEEDEEEDDEDGEEG
jgi:hypothetical protein